MRLHTPNLVYVLALMEKSIHATKDLVQERISLHESTLPNAVFEGGHSFDSAKAYAYCILLYIY